MENITGSRKLTVIANQFENEKKYWLEKLAGELPRSHFPYDRKDPGTTGWTAETLTFRLTERTTSTLMKLSSGSDSRLYMVLVAGVMVLLQKYTGSDDIIVGSPVLKQDAGSDFINTELALRQQLEDHMTFKDLLLAVRQVIFEAAENQNYPMGTLMYQLNTTGTHGEYPLFDVAVLLDNIHDEEYIRENKPAITFSFSRTAGDMEARCSYNPLKYREDTIRRITTHFKCLMEQALRDVNLKITDIDILSREEKTRLLSDFNGPVMDYPREKTLVRLFEEQVRECAPEDAVQDETGSLTYAELNERANRLAHLLRSSGVKPNMPVGLMLGRSTAAIVGMLGILKAGGAYLPIDPENPVDRIRFMLEDSGIRFLLTRDPWTPGDFTGTVVNMTGPGAPEFHRFDGSDPAAVNTPDDLLYIIYTSGTTGKPKGVLIRQRGFVNLIRFHQGVFGEGRGDRLSQVANLSFDAMAFEVWPCLVNGATLAIADDRTRMDPVKMKEWLIREKITVSFQPTIMTEHLLEQEWPAEGAALRILRTAGDKLNRYPPGEYPFRLYNLYGPTEDTVWTTVKEVGTGGGGAPPIGKPIANHRIYILGKNLKLQPPGVPGELCIGGDGLAAGYLNRPRLTMEKFPWVRFTGENAERIYRTGDLAKWLPDGDLEFLGRTDWQVKIRGFRVEPGEIENRLLQHHSVRESCVVARGNGNGDKQLVAYVVPAPGLTVEDLENYLKRNLPAYMVPTAFVTMDELPLTPNGKVDRNALPLPGAKTRFIPPRDPVEKKLAEIWSGVVTKDKDAIGIDDDFFEMGGHSLKATIVTTAVHKELNAAVPLVELFKNPTIRGLARYIKANGETGENYADIQNVEKKEYYPPSPAQRRLYVVQQMQKDNIGYNLPLVLMMEGKLDIERIREVLNLLVARHESFRTGCELVEGEPVQKIHEEVDLDIEYYDAHDGDTREIDTIITRFVRVFDLGRPPLMRAGLIALGERKHILMLDMHHIITDGTSMGILVREFMTLYQSKPLAPPVIQYKDFSQWQNRRIRSGEIKKQEDFWIEQYSREIPRLNLPLDYSRTTLQEFGGQTVEFTIPRDRTAALNRAAKESNTTLYTVLLAIFNVLTAKLCGQQDIVVGTPVAGRRHADLQTVIGMFVNMLALRNFPTPEKTFLHFLHDVNERTLNAFENQEYQFEDLVEQVAVNRDTGRSPLFDVTFSLQNTEIPEFRIPGMKLSLMEKEIDKSRFDLVAVGIEVDSRIDFRFRYSTRLFKPETVQRFARYFQGLIDSIPGDTRQKIGDMEIVTEEEKHRVLFEFNTTSTRRPTRQTIHRVFEDRARRTPDRHALIDETRGRTLTYRELNETANRLARRMQFKGIRIGDIVGIPVDGFQRPLETVTGILGVLKAGAAYLPLERTRPVDYTRRMPGGGTLKVLVTRGPDPADNAIPRDSLLYIEPDEIRAGEAGDLTGNASPLDPACVLYTPGNTRGVALLHHNLNNLVFALDEAVYRRHGENLGVALVSPFASAASLGQVFGALLLGHRLCGAPGDVFNDGGRLIRYLREHEIEILNGTPSQARLLLEGMTGNAPSLHLKLHLKHYIVGGEPLPRKILRGLLDRFAEGHADTRDIPVITHMYGTVESCGAAALHEVSRDTLSSYGGVPVGRPLVNARVYIVDSRNRLQPPGIYGELCIGGGVPNPNANPARPLEENFIHNPFLAGEVMVKTGDIARWLPDGNIEFAGRKDRRVNINGSLLDPAGIEACLLEHPLIDAAAVLEVARDISEIREGDNPGNTLCAYIVSSREFAASRLTEYLAREFPAYLIPTYFMQLEKMPLTPEGKVDTHALLAPGIKPEKKYAPPRDILEEKLTLIWSEALEMEKERIGIDDFFFDLGGQSLKAIMISSRVHKEFDVRIPISEVFKLATIERMAAHIKKTRAELQGDKYLSISPAVQKNYYELSPSQKRLYFLQQMDRESINYNMPQVVKAEGELDARRLEDAFRGLVARHESFRTSFVMVDDKPVQKIHPPRHVQFNLEHFPYGGHSPGETEAERIKAFVRHFDLSRAPLLRVGLLENPGKGYILILDMHHIISDAASRRILIQDFTRLYNGQSLPELTLQYKDYSEWLSRPEQEAAVARQEEYWLKEFEGPVPQLNLPADFPRSSVRNPRGNTLQFRIDPGPTRGLKKIAMEENATMYMVLLAVYYILLSKLSNQEEVVVGTDIIGRTHNDLEGIIGIFINTLALKNHVDGQMKFSRFLEKLKEKTLNAFQNQGYQFEDLVAGTAVDRDGSRNPLFDVMFSLQSVQISEVRLDRVKLTPHQYENSTAKFDLILGGAVREDDIVMTLEYSTRLFKKETIEKYIKCIGEIIGAIVENRDIELKDIALSHRLAAAKPNVGRMDFGFPMSPQP